MQQTSQFSPSRQKSFGTIEKRKPIHQKQNGAKFEKIVFLSNKILWLLLMKTTQAYKSALTDFVFSNFFFPTLKLTRLTMGDAIGLVMYNWLPFEFAVMKRMHGAHIRNMNILWKMRSEDNLVLSASFHYKRKATGTGLIWGWRSPN